MDKQKKQTGKIAKVPVIMQLEEQECGAASLAMISAYYGKWVTLEQTRKDCGISRDGSTAKSIALAAMSYGLKVEAYTYTTKTLMKQAFFPCIIHWDYNHFLVLKGFKNNKAYINDPARGDIVVDIETFDRSFTGVCLTFEPKEDFKPEGKKKSIYKYVFKRLKETGGAFAFIAVVTVIGAIIAIFEPGFNRIYIDNFLGGNNHQFLTGFSIFFLLLSLCKIVNEALTCVQNNRIGAKLAASGASTFIWKVLRLPIEFFTQRSPGDMISRKSSNETLVTNMVFTLAPLGFQVVVMIFYLVVMVNINVYMAAVGVISVILNIFVTRFVNKKLVNFSRISARDMGALSNETISGIEMIESTKAAGNESGAMGRWMGCASICNNDYVQLKKLVLYYGIIPQLLNSLASIIVIGMGVYLTMNGMFTVGTITAFSGYLSGFSKPAGALIQATQTIQTMTVDMERVEDVLAYPEDEILKPGSEETEENIEKLAGKIEFNHITFGYNRLRKPVINDFNLTIEPGQTVAIVGASGCGKSTISKLASGLYSPWEGEILYDGKKINEISRGVFTKSVSLVDQDIVLFEESIENNISMMDPFIPQADVIRAAEDAGINADIIERPDGYQGMLIENGRNFSGGQRQRIEIARALAVNPSVIIMDEATSALDAKTEAEVAEAIRQRGISCIIIAHRLSTIRNSDKIIVLQNGEIVEAGTHKELIRDGKYYSELVTSE